LFGVEVKKLRNMSEPRVPQTTSFSAEPMEKMQSQWVGTSAEHCQKMIDFAKNRSPMVKFMIDKLDEVRPAQLHRLSELPLYHMT